MEFEKDRIVITGVPGTGKSTVSSRLSEKTELSVTHVNGEFLKKNELNIRKDIEAGSWEVNLDELRKVVKNLEGILESHLLCEFSLPSTLVIVLRCRPETLKKRIKGRGYPEKKVKENLEAEAVDYCTQRSEENYEEVFEVETTNRSIEETVDKCLGIIKGRGEGDNGIDYSDYLLSSF